MIERNVEAVRERIRAAAQRAGRSDADAVRVLAATKYVDASTIAQLAAAGVTDVAENRLDALVAKQAELAGAPGSEGLHWHFIGALQSRKVGEVAERVGLIHSLCSESAARRLGAIAEQGGHVPGVLVQVNVDGDPGKDGVAPLELGEFVQTLPGGVAVHGLMTMPAFASEPEQSRGAFAQLAGLLEELRGQVGGGRHPLDQLSMGTSQDFEVAVEEGATLVRLGRVLYAAQD